LAHQAEISGKNYEVLTTFMQNKANFRKSQVNVSIYLQTAYEYKRDWTLGENKPNSNPIKANLKRAQMNVNSLITKDYRKNDAFAVQKNKANSNPISEKPKMNVNLYVIEDYENERRRRLQKNKPNQSQFSNRKTDDRRQTTEDFFAVRSCPKNAYDQMVFLTKVLQLS